eukprot:CAMPEP_0116061836 /NCGR_PEP_ID=MMETSP0322-20121206/7327_1 /TAXON_ID=163516 /ORGANISM="Leptocylindrus danicus var. apora, Strain B651" /LENGTH=341 /DNA_ID=CAMNT_0003546881 /DNA_START=84 /DNA_END=1109 /DNA_ORIENTATION=-
MHLLLYTYLLTSLTIATSGWSNPSSSSSEQKPHRAILVTGANKGQGKALCERILDEYDDTFIFLCSRDLQRGLDAAAGEELVRYQDRIRVIQLDVTCPSSVIAAVQDVQKVLRGFENGGKLYGIVSNAGILWGHTLLELMDVCATGVARVLDNFLPLMQEDGRVIVVSSGLAPLMLGYADSECHEKLMSGECSWEGTIEPMIYKCLETYDKYSMEDRPKKFAEIGFPGGPFAEVVPDFHMYGLAKMFADVYMLSLSKSHLNLRINSVDPGLVYTDLILKMEKYAGKEIEDTGAQTPKQGVEAAMRLLFEEGAGKSDASGEFYAMNKEKTNLVHSAIDVKPN